MEEGFAIEEAVPLGDGGVLCLAIGGGMMGSSRRGLLLHIRPDQMFRVDADGALQVATQITPVVVAEDRGEQPFDGVFPLRTFLSGEGWALVVGEGRSVLLTRGHLLSLFLPKDEDEPLILLDAAQVDWGEGKVDWFFATNRGLLHAQGNQASFWSFERMPFQVKRIVAFKKRERVVLWAIEENALWRIELAQGGRPIASLRLKRQKTLEGLAIDGQGRPWWIEGGALHALSFDGHILKVELPSQGLARFLFGSPEGEVWLFGEGARGLFCAHWDGFFWRECRVPQEFSEGSSLRCASGSMCWGVKSGKLFRLRVRRFVEVTGLPSDGRLREVARVRIQPENPDALEAIRLRIDNAPSQPTERSFEIDPQNLSRGHHSIEITVRWREPILPHRLKFALHVPPPATWANDIFPLFRNHCELCHGRNASKPLHTSEAWKQNIDRILQMIESRAMPLSPAPPLTQDQIRLVRVWKEAGFPD
ncbi:MAG: hypothetical protein NZM37_09275 [Sandaracinaceae bacterium]|nr:hypothetical protein [Sandaracinaceae bacterium]